MNLVDSILNLALLFLWIDWRSGRIARQPKAILSLANAVRPLERGAGSGLGSLAILVLILLLRPLIYHSIGSKLGWTPEVDLLAFTLPWRSDLLDLMYVFSTLTFLLTFGFFYSAVLLLSVVNRRLPETDVMQQFVRLQLGWLDKIPWPIKLLLPIFLTGLTWMALAPLLVRIGLLPSLPPMGVLLGQAIGFGIAALLGLKWFLAALFLLHLLNIYVYLGKHPIWSYISATSRTLLRPLAFLTFPRIDLAPLGGMAVVFCIAEFVIKPLALQIFQRFSV